MKKLIIILLFAPLAIFGQSTLNVNQIPALPESKITSLTTDLAAKVTGTITAANKATIVASTGDSMTADTWEPQLQTSLGLNYAVLSFGRPGDQTNGMLARQNGGISSIGASYQIVLGGINDISAGVTALAIEANLQAIYTSAHNAGSKVIALTILPFGASAIWTSGRQAVADSVNTWILGVATNLDYKIDTRPVLWDPSNHLNLNPAYASGDFLHPNTAGYNLIGTTIYSNVPFVVSTATPMLYLSKNSVINQNLQSDQSVFWKNVNTFILKVTSSRDPSYPMPQIPSYLLPYFVGTKGAMAYDTTNNVIRTRDGSHWRMAVSMDSVGNVFAPSNSITFPALTQVGGQFTVTNTAIQQYLRYDLSNYASFSVNSGGSLTINTTGGTIGSSGGFLGLDFLSASTGLINSSSGSNASYATPTTGAVISRNVADANPALIIKQTHASSTGDIVQWKNSAGTVANMTQAGVLNLTTLSASLPVLTDASKNLVSGTIPNSGLTNNTISGIALGSNLANLTATDATLTFSGTYTGGTARTIGLNLANANTWTALQTFNADALATTPVDRIMLSNTTAAANNAQQYSPDLVWASNGWSTTGGTSTNVRFREYSIPLQGATAAGELVIDVSRDGGSTWSNVWQLLSSGIFNVGGNGTGSLNAGTTTISLGKELKVTEGTNGFAGQTTLVSGTKAITISGVTTASRAFAQLVTPSGATSTVQYQAVCTANTLTIQADVAAGTINTADGSTLNYFIVN